MQAGILVDCISSGRNGTYVQQLQCDVDEPFDRGRFERAWARLADMHPALRTCFDTGDGEPMQRVVEKVDPVIEFADWNDESATAIDQATESFLDQDRRRGLDIGSAPLFRVTVFLLSADRFRFVWTSHHLLFDGRSRYRLLQDVFGLYAAKSELPPSAPSTPYREFVERCRDFAIDDARRYWRGAWPLDIDVMSVVDEFGACAPHGADGHGVLRRRLDRSLTHAIAAASDRLDVGKSTLFHAAWGLISHRYTGATWSVFGVTRSCRPRSNESVGLFVNTLPLALKLDHDDTVSSLVKRARGSWQALEPFERSAITDIAVWRQHRHRLFDVILNYEAYELNERLRGNGEEWRKRRFSLHGTTGSPLVISISAGERIELEFVYDRAVFDDAVAASILDQYIRVLSQLARSGDRRVSDITLVTSEMFGTLTTAADDDGTPIRQSVVDRFEAIAAAHPGSTALLCGEERLTYEELDRKADRVAVALRNCGIRRGARVGVLLKRNGDLAASLIGILKSGAAYVPLDPRYPVDRTRFMVGDAAIEVVVSCGRHHDRALGLGKKVILVDSLPACTKPDPQWRRERPDADTPAYVMYTSGSTGEPKGVVIPHRGIVRLVCGNDYVPLGPERVFLLHSSMVFDASTFELWGALLNGARCVVPDVEFLEPGPLGDVIADYGVDCLWLTSSLFNLVVDECVQKLRPIKYLLIGGEDLSVPHVTRALSELPSTRLINGYGPTENTTFTCAYQIPANFDPARRHVPIGRPIRGSHVYILDQAGAPVPPGCPGELVIGGAGLALGYLNRDDSTSASFVRDPFRSSGDGMVYRSGDRCRWLDSGDIEFLGRADEQHKVRGFRVEPGETNAALEGHPAVAVAATMVVTSRNDDKRIESWAVPHTPGSVRGPDLQEYLAERLPHFNLPWRINVIDRMPLTVGGKIDRRRLLAGSARPTERTSPMGRSTLFHGLCDIRDDVLGIDGAGSGSGFFDLGGDSLSGMRFLQRVEERFGIRLALADLLAAPNMEDLVGRIPASAGVAGAAIGASGRADHLPSLPFPDRGVNGGGGAPLSSAQARLWFLDRLDPGANAYIVRRVWRVRGDLDLRMLDAALCRLVERHEILRLRIRTTGGVPVQDDLPPFTPLSVVDHAAVAPDARQRLERDLMQPMSLERGPLFRARAVKVSERDHWLGFAMHHIVTDGWSMNVLWRDLSALYSAVCDGTDAELEPLSLRFRDFANWQQTLLRERFPHAQLDYWKTKLEGFQALDLGGDGIRSAAGEDDSDRMSLRVDAKTNRRLQRIARRRDATLYMVALTALKCLLARYSGQSDIVLGSVASYRPFRQLEPLVGFFTNTLVLRTLIDTGRPFKDLLAAVKKTCLEALDNQDVPFETLVEAVNPVRSADRHPFFDVMFVMNNTDPETLHLGNTDAALEEAAEAGAKFDITFRVDHARGGLDVHIGYRRSVIDETRVHQLGRHYVRLLEAIAASPDLPVNDLPMLSTSELRLQTRDWRRTRSELPPGATIHGLIEASANDHPGRIALQSGGDTLTYRALNGQANQLAQRLRVNGVRPGSHVGLLMDRSIDSVVAILGILKCGGAFVPMDIDWPDSRLEYVIENSQISITVTRGDCARRHAALPCEWVRVDDPPADAHGKDDAAPEVDIDQSVTAYIMYTSGSTGRPKGVRIAHRSLVNYTLAAVKALNLEGMSSYALVQPLTADSSGTILWCALSTGATLHIRSVEESLDGPLLGDYLNEHEIDVLKILPSHFEALQSPDRLSVLPRKRLVFGGEMARPHLVDSILSSPHAPEVYNHYGPTESTIGVSACRLMPQHVDGRRRYLPVGRPFDNCRLHVLDDQLRAVPLGTHGEVYVGGDCLAQGYQGNDELTASAFVGDPFGEPGDRLYRTGDIGFMEADGMLRVVGRRDHQIKIRGYRVETGEINAAMMECRGVDQAASFLVGSGDGPVELAAIYVSRSGLAPIELERHVRTRLPDYMVPRRFVASESIPRISTGKADLHSLGQGLKDDATAGGASTPIRTLEERILSIWRGVLRLDGLEHNDNFFEAGGHSLLAAQLISSLSHELGRQVPLRYLFENPTVAGLSARLERAWGDHAPVADLVRIDKQARSDRIPLSHAQQRIWFMDQFDGSKHFYNMHRLWRIHGAVDVRALECAFAEIVGRHEILRTVYVEENGELYQRAAAPGPFVIKRISSAGDPSPLMQRELERPFDLSRDLTLRASLLACPDGSQLLLVVVHHIASDAWSMSVIFRELGEVYNALVGGERPALLPLPLQYADYALWQRGWLERSEMQRQLSYWRHKLDGLERVELPMDNPRPQTPTYAGSRESIALSAETADALRGLASDSDSTLFMVLLCAFKILLYRYSGNGDITVGTPIANRHHRDIEPLVGFFANTLVFRDRLEGDMSFYDLLGQVRQTCLEAYEHQDLPFDRLVEAIQPNREAGRHPLFDALILLHNVPDENLHLDELAVERAEHHAGIANFDLLFLPIERGGGIELVFVYRTELFMAGTIARLLRQMVRILTAAAREPSTSISALPLIGRAERRTLLEKFSGPRMQVRHRSMVDMLEAATERGPDAPALEFGGETVTYLDLHERANRLANHLLGGGVAPGDRVGVLLDRGFDSIVALMAVLKTGGVYVPLDTQSPPERVKALASIVSLRTLVTDSKSVCHHPPVTRLVDLERVRDAVGREDPSPPRVDIDPGAAAYIMFTSGSTGTPKACENVHNALVSLFEWQTAQPRLREAARTLQYCSLSFDVCLQEIMGCLATGGTLVLVDEATRRDPDRLARYLDDHHIERIFITSVALHDLVVRMQILECGGSLRDIISTGDQLRITPAVRDFLRSNRACRLHNHYGPVETHVATALMLQNDPADWPELPPIGRPINNNRILILDAAMQLAPISGRGEICIAGPGVAGEYLNRDTEARNRFSSVVVDGEDIPIYRTGDIGRYLADGSVEFLGRGEELVKIRGYRVAPAEVESVLIRHPAVRSAAVLAHSDDPVEPPFLAAYVVADGEFDARGLRSYLGGLLPDYMVPTVIIEVEEIPKNSRSKVDRRALPAPRMRGQAHPDPPRNEIEQRLLGLWSNLLPVDNIGINDSFFDLGGHSLLAASLIAKLNLAFELSLTTASLFKAPSITLLAEEINRRLDRPLPDADRAPARDAGDNGSGVGRADAHPRHRRVVTPAYYDRPLQEIIAAGELASVDSAAIGYVPDKVLARFGGDRTAAADAWCRQQVAVRAIVSSSLGRIAAITIPMVQAQLYEEPERLASELIKAHDLAASIGAGSISLVGVLPTTTDYGLALTRALADREAVLDITTGHDITSSSIVLSVQRLLALCGRGTRSETVGFLGLGAIGRRALRLMLRVLPHPPRLLLCDLYSQMEHLEEMAEEIRRLGYDGELTVAPTRQAIPAEFYEASLIVGATNVPDVLEIPKLQPGTLIVDDSAPHCFDVTAVYDRLLRRSDVLYTEGGLLETPFPLEHVAYINGNIAADIQQAFRSLFRKSDRHIGGCVLSSLLVQRYAGYDPAIGEIDVDRCMQGYELLSKLGFQAAEPHCNPHRVPPDLIDRFVRSYGADPGRVSDSSL